MILLQNPNMPVPTNAVEIDAAILDIKAHLEAGLTWLTNGYGRTYKNLDARNGTTVFYPEAYLGEQNNSHRYINLSPDNDKQGQCFFYVVKETISQFQPGMYSFLSYDTAIIFSVNMELIDDILLETEIYQQILVAQVRDVLTRQLIGSSYQLSITSVDFLFETVFAEFDLADAQQLEKAPLSHFRFNCTIQLPEECPVPTIIPGPFMTGMSLWLKADAGVNGGIVANGDPVDTWADQSGKGNDFTQAVFVNQPTFLDVGVNGRSGISFTSPNILESIGTNFFLSNEGVVFVVCKKNAPSTGGQYGVVLTLNASNYAAAGSSHMILSAFDVLGGFPSNSYYFNMFNSSLELDFGLSGTSGTILTTKKTLTDSEGKRDGVVVDTGTGAQTLAQTYNSIGQWGVVGRTFEGEVYEVIIYEYAISDTEIVQTENYLKLKYNIA